MADRKTVIEILRADFPNLSGPAYEHLEAMVDHWFKLGMLIHRQEPSPDKVKAFVAQVKSSLHLVMM